MKTTKRILVVGNGCNDSDEMLHWVMNYQHTPVLVLSPEQFKQDWPNVSQTVDRYPALVLVTEEHGWVGTIYNTDMQKDIISGQKEV